MKIDGVPPSVAEGPPALGADTEAVLRDIGLPAEEIARLRAEGVI